MTEQEVKIEKLEKEVEILKKRVDFFYNEIRPMIRRENCHLKHCVLDDNGQAVACYSKYQCTSCEYYNEYYKESEKK